MLPSRGEVAACTREARRPSAHLAGLRMGPSARGRKDDRAPLCRVSPQGENGARSRNRHRDASRRRRSISFDTSFRRSPRDAREESRREIDLLLRSPHRGLAFGAIGDVLGEHVQRMGHLEFLDCEPHVELGLGSPRRLSAPLPPPIPAVLDLDPTERRLHVGLRTQQRRPTVPNGCSTSIVRTLIAVAPAIAARCPAAGSANTCTSSPGTSIRSAGSSSSMRVLSHRGEATTRAAAGLATVVRFGSRAALIGAAACRGFRRACAPRGTSVRARCDAPRAARGRSWPCRPGRVRAA